MPPAIEEVLRSTRRIESLFATPAVFEQLRAINSQMEAISKAVGFVRSTNWRFRPLDSGGLLGRHSRLLRTSSGRSTRRLSPAFGSSNYRGGSFATYGTRRLSRTSGRADRSDSRHFRPAEV